MTYVSLKNENFFEQFDSMHIAPHLNDIESYELVYSAERGIALDTPSSSLGRIWRWGTSFNVSENIKYIIETAKSTFAMISAPSPTTPEERIISTCRAASRTCLSLDRIIKHALQTNGEDSLLKDHHKMLDELGKGFLRHESTMLAQHPVRVACQNGTLHAALDLIKDDNSSITKAIGHYTPLLKLAFEQKQYKLCRQFINLGADPIAAFGDKVKEYATALLCHAIKDGQEKVAIVLVEVGANPNLAKDGKSPLHMAASAGFSRLVEELINKGADINALDSTRNTPLHDACRAYKADVALLLVQKGADVARINREIDEETKAVRPGTCAFRIPALINKQASRTTEFYCKILASYQPRDILTQGGLDAFLADCIANPDKLIRGLSGPNPFEVAMLFQDSLIATKVVERMPLSRFFDYLKKLKTKYPACGLDHIEFCYLARNDAHLSKKIPQLDTYPPSRDVSLDDILTYNTNTLKVYGKQFSTKEVTPIVRAFIARIQGKADMPALMSSEQEKASFYELLEQRCLKNIIITFQDSPQNKELQEKKTLFLREIVDLEQGEHCAGRYYGVITKLFRTFCTGGVKTFEEELYILLAEHRELLLEQCLDPMKGNNRSDYNFLLAQLGDRLTIPGFDTCKYYHDLCGQIDLEIAQVEFFKRYTVASIIKDCVEPALQHNKDLRDKFSEWMLQKMPSDWGDALRQHLQALQARPTTTHEQIREFLRKNGVAIEDDSTNFMQALDAARRQAYLEREVFEGGKIKPIAISRMLAGLERPVLSSNKLQHESSPITFACDWLQDIIDMVKN